MGSIRYYVKLPLLFAWTFFCWGLWLSALLSTGCSDRRSRALRRPVVRLWGAGLLRILGARVRQEGTPPKPPYFIVSNHLSYVDVFFLAQQMGCVFVARANMQRWPIMGRIASSSQQIFIDRRHARDSMRVMGLIEDVLAKNDGLHVFAESTCSRGAEVCAFKPALFEVAAEKGIPIHCAALSYITPEGEPAASDCVAWWRSEPLSDHLRRLLRLPGFEAVIRYADAPLTGEDRKALAQKAHDQVAALFTPLEQGVLEELDVPKGRMSR